MINAVFYGSGGIIKGFQVSGHAGYADKGADVVCAAVSSAVQLSVNIMTESFRAGVDVSAEDDTVRCFAEIPSEATSSVMRVLRAHFESIAEEYPKTIEITTLEV